MISIRYLLILSATTVVGFLLMWILGMIKHKKRVSSYRNAVSPEVDKTMFNILLKRYVGYMSNYYAFQGIGKSCEILSLIYSIGTLGIVLDNQTSQNYSGAISLAAVFFVVATLYICPSKRWREYLCSARKCEELALQIINGEKTTKDIPGTVVRSENTITSDTD